jgi:hypothetical protein
MLGGLLFAIAAIVVLCNVAVSCIVSRKHARHVGEKMDNRAARLVFRRLTSSDGPHATQFV